MHSWCIIRAKKQGVLEADGNRGYAQSLPLALRRYVTYVPSRRLDHLTKLTISF